MYGFLLALLVLDGIFLAIVVLLQAGKGGGLAAMGGGVTATEGILAGRQATTVLTRATWTAGGIFMGLALVLSILSSRAQQPRSILLDDLRQTAPAPEPILPGLPDTPPPGEPGGEIQGGGILPPTGSPDGRPDGI
jgi:preprotein translocase subunit SecG